MFRPHTPTRLGTGGVLTPAGGRTGTVATHQEENTHASLRVRTITGHHASPGMFPLTLPLSEGGRDIEASRGTERR